MRIILVAIFLFLINISQAQNSARVEYFTFFSFVNNVEYESFLFFDNTNSLFSYKVIGDGFYEKENNENLQYNTVLVDTTTNIIVLDNNENRLYESHLSKNTQYFSTEEIPFMEWKLLSSVKKIKSIDCLLAKTSFRGRVFYAWYAPEIPVSYGPWKLNGLPGLIVEAYDEAKEVMFKFKNIKAPYRYDFEGVKDNINELDNVSLLQYIEKERNIDASTIESKINAKSSRGTSVKVEVKMIGIELNFDDVLESK